MAALIMNNKDLLYVIKPEEQNESTLRELLTLHPEIQFVSLMGVDFAGNDTALHLSASKSCQPGIPLGR